VRWIAVAGNPSRATLFNEAISRVGADWIKLLEPSDQLLPFALEGFRQVGSRLTAHTQVVLGGFLRTRGGAYQETVHDPERLLFDSTQLAELPPAAVFLRRQAALEAGLFNPEENERICLTGLFRRLRERYRLAAFGIMRTPLACR
jgi:hypothetical protein